MNETINLELSITERVVQTLQDVCKEPCVLDEQMHLFNSGILDSFGVINLITLLEQEFGQKIGMEELTMDNFKSIACIVALVARLRKES